MKWLLTIFLFIYSLNLLAQTGCRRISDGILFQNQILFSPDYNANIPGPNASAFCLPRGTVGSTCTIRIPFTTTSSPGIYGTFTALNCDIDHYGIGAIVLGGIIGVRWMRNKKTSAS